MTNTTEKPEKKAHPFYEVAANAENMAKQGHEVYQKFWCANCGTPQHIEEPNHFYTSGRCEECGHVTDLIKEGCNFLLLMKLKPPVQDSDIPSCLTGKTDKQEHEEWDALRSMSNKYCKQKP